MLSYAQPIDVKGGTALCLVERGFAKLGANALALLAISKYTAITKDNTWVKKGRQLALWIGHAQEDDGSFKIFKQDYQSQEILPFVSGYYPGEAIFALLRFYQVDKNPVWLAVAEKAADYLIHSRDVDKTINSLDHDHWLLYGLKELYSIKPKPEYVLHTVKICQAIIQSQNTQSSPIDYVGSFYKNPRSTPAATRS